MAANASDGLLAAHRASKWGGFAPLFIDQSVGHLLNNVAMVVTLPSLRHAKLLLVVPLAGLLTGCDMLGIETPGMTNLKKEAEGKAIGAACRHAVRSLEDCYGSNPRVSKAAIFEGWREMDAYMRENEIEGMPQTPATAPSTSLPEESIVPSASPGSATTAPPGSSSPPATPAANAPPSSSSPAPSAPQTGTIALPARPNLVPTR